MSDYSPIGRPTSVITAEGPPGEENIPERNDLRTMRTSSTSLSVIYDPRTMSDAADCGGMNVHPCCSVPGDADSVTSILVPLGLMLMQ